MNEQVKAELEHLVRLMAPPFTANWKAYCWNKAKTLAADPQYSELPALLVQSAKELTQ